MKRRNNRFLAGTLAGLMMLTMLPVTALAAADGTAENGAPVSGASDNGIENVVNDTGVSQDTGANADANDTGDANPTAGNDGGGETGGEPGGADSSEKDSTPAPAPESYTAKIDGVKYDTLDAAIEAVQGDEVIEGGENNTPAPTFTAKIGGTEYETLDAAINAAQDGDTIEIGQDITVGADGLTISEKGNLTIKNAEGTEPTITMNGLGMYFNATNVTFQNIKIVEEGVSDNPIRSGATTNLFDDCILTFDNSTLVLNGSGEGSKRHGMFLYQSSDMYVTNNSKIIISGFNQEKASGIYIDESEEDADKNPIHNKIEVTSSSSIKITDCAWNGMTVNPTDVKIDGSSTIDISKCGKNGGRGGLGCYYGTITISNDSSLVVDNNLGSHAKNTWGIFADGLSVDSTSSLSACNNTSYGVQLGSTSNIASGAKVTISNNDKAGLVVYTGSNYWFGDVTIEEGAHFTASGNANGIEVRRGGVLNMQDGTVTNNHSNSYGGGLFNRGGNVEIGSKAAIYNNHANIAGDDIYSVIDTYEPSLTLSPVCENWVLDDCKDPIVGWYHDGKEKRWNGDGKDTGYYADEYEVKAEAVSDALALKAAHGKFCNVTYEVTGDKPSDAGNPPAPAKVKMGGSYTVAPAQTTSQSRYTFSGWRADGTGDIVTSLENLQQDVKLVGVWSYRSGGGSSGGGGGRKPTVDIPDDVPTGLNGDDHFAYIVGYPDGNVKPGGNITRAEVATIFFRLLTEDVRTANSTQSNSLSDVSRGQWFNHAISTLSSMGIVKGNPDGTFDPDAPITRAEFAAIAARFDDKNTNTTSNFSDIASHWAKDEIGVAANKGWINGYPDSTFRPDQYITRAEAMTLVNRVLNRLPEKSEDLLDDMIKWPDNADASVWYYLAVQEATNSHDYSDKSDADKYEKWTKIRDARDWTLLEK